MPTCQVSASICDECATGEGRTPGLIKSEGVCASCGNHGLISITTVAPANSRHVINSEAEAAQRRAQTSSTSRTEGTARCPHCETVIEDLHYHIDRYEYGRCNLRGDGDWNTNGFENDGEFIFSCPECGQELDVDDIVYGNNDEDESEDGEDTKE
jgi:uncharacterized C2H2 Zn-finger protein